MRTTVTFPDSLYRKAQVRMKERDFTAFADYLQSLIREDTKHLPTAENGRGAYVMNDTPPTPVPPPPDKPPKKPKR